MMDILTEWWETAWPLMLYTTIGAIGLIVLKSMICGLPF